jgi:hypothetical protein
MALVAGVEGSGRLPALKAAVLSEQAPFVRSKEDVPHEGSIPDLYGLEVEEAIERAIEQGLLRWSVNLETGETVLVRSIRQSNA